MRNPKILQVKDSITSYRVPLSQSNLTRLKDLETIAKDVFGQPVSVSAVFSRALVALLDDYTKQLRKLKRHPEEVDAIVMDERRKLWNAARE